MKKPQRNEYKQGYVSYERSQEIVDFSTGEIISHITGVVRKSDKEPDYVKLYLNTMMSFNGISGIPIDVIISLCGKVQGYINNDNEPLIFTNNSYNKEKMSKELGISVDMIAKYIKKLADSGILIKTEKRSIYYVNPWILARGKWDNIKKLQLHFDIVNGSWQVDLVNDIKQDE